MEFLCLLNECHVNTTFFFQMKANIKFLKIMNEHLFIRVSLTGFLESDLVPKLKIDEFWYDLWNSVKKNPMSII